MLYFTSEGDGVGYHCQNDSKVIPPKGMDDKNAREQAEEQEEDHKDEEEGGKAVDGRFPVAFGRGHGPNPWWAIFPVCDNLGPLCRASSLETSSGSPGFLRDGIAVVIMRRRPCRTSGAASLLHLTASIASYSQR